MKTSKITKIQGAGEKNGWLNYDIDLDDGTSGSKGFKTQPTYLSVGTEVEYELHPEYPNFFKTMKVKGYNGGGKKSAGNNSSFALSYAKDFCIAKDTNGIPQKPADVTAVADTFLKWLNENG